MTSFFLFRCLWLLFSPLLLAPFLLCLSLFTVASVLIHLLLLISFFLLFLSPSRAFLLCDPFAISSVLSWLILFLSVLLSLVPFCFTSLRSPASLLWTSHLWRSLSCIIFAESLMISRASLLAPLISLLSFHSFLALLFHVFASLLCVSVLCCLLTRGKDKQRNLIFESATYEKANASR